MGVVCELYTMEIVEMKAVKYIEEFCEFLKQDAVAWYLVEDVGGIIE